MKYKEKTLSLKRARQEKRSKLHYFGYYLPATEGFLNSEQRYVNY